MPAQVKSARAAYAQQILNRYLLKKTGKSHLPRLELTPHKSDFAAAPDPPYTGRICIVGAGACGLYLAMMLKYLGYGNVDILEASDRVGGRCFTYPKPGDTDTHSYYDIGAMRIPDIPWMQHVLKFTRETLNLDDKVVPYIYNNTMIPGPPVCYNYQHQPIKDQSFNDIMDGFINQFGFMSNFDQAFADWLQPDPKTGDLKDNFSTKSWLMLKANPVWTYDQIATAELSDTSTGLFDQSLTETVIDYADFAAADKQPWWRVDGGMQTVTDTMQTLLASPSWPAPDKVPGPHPSPTLKLQTPVIAMATALDDNEMPCIKVTTAADPSNPVAYDMVFNTTAMAPLQRMDLSSLNLPLEIHTGIRTLSYDRATKVVIKFKTPWWFQSSQSFADKSKNPIWGGVSSSDLPISNVVYPSWNDGPDQPAVLMVSYSWAQDATRMGALLQDYSLVKPTKSDAILKLCLQNLVTLWEETDIKPSYEWLMDQVLDDGSPCAPYHAWAWSHDPYTGGAFALFGPGQFQNVYPAFMGLQCNGNLALCGEALSAHHAWISGAWASAYMQLMAFLKDRKQNGAADRLTNSEFGGVGGGGGNRSGRPGGGKGDLDRGGDEARGSPHPEEMDESLLLHLLKLRQREWGR